MVAACKTKGAFRLTHQRVFLFQFVLTFEDCCCFFALVAAMVVLLPQVVFAAREEAPQPVAVGDV